MLPNLVETLKGPVCRIKWFCILQPNQFGNSAPPFTFPYQRGGSMADTKKKMQNAQPVFVCQFKATQKNMADCVEEAVLPL